MKIKIPFLKKPPLVPILRLSGVIGGAGRFSSGLTDAGLAPLIERAFTRGTPAAGDASDAGTAPEQASAGGAGAGAGASRGNSSRSESVFSAADFSDAEAYADYVGGVGGHGVKPRGGSAHGSTDKVNRAMAREGRAGPSSAHASAFARPPPPHLQSRSSGGSSNLSTGKPPRPFAAPMAGAGRPVPPERPPQIVKSTTRFL